MLGVYLPNKKSKDEGLRDGSGSPQRSEDYSGQPGLIDPQWTMRREPQHILCLMIGMKIKKIQKQKIEFVFGLKILGAKKLSGFNRRFFCYYFSFVIQLSFAYMGTVAYMCFACCTINT